MLTSIFPPLNPHLRQDKQTNAYLPASPYGCLSALILIVDRTCSAGEVDEMRREEEVVLKVVSLREFQGGPQQKRRIICFHYNSIHK